MLLPRGEQRDQCAEDQSGDEAADVGSVVDAGDCGSEDQIVENKCSEAAQGSGKRGARHGKFAQLESREQCAGEAENGTRRSYAEHGGSPEHASETASHSTEEINGDVGPRPVERFAQRAQVPQAPHVEGDVDDAAVNEDAGQQPPPFAGEGVGTVVSAPAHEVQAGETHHGRSGERHAKKDGQVDAEDNLRHPDGGCTGTDPWSGHDGLPGVFGDFAALVGFVLLAPLADFLAEGKAGKLAATADAVGHDLNIKSISSSLA